MSDEASIPDPAAPANAAPGAAAPAGAPPPDPLTRAFEAVRRAQADNDDAPDIAADDAGATSLAEEIGADAEKP